MLKTHPLTFFKAIFLNFIKIVVAFFSKNLGILANRKRYSANHTSETTIYTSKYETRVEQKRLAGDFLAGSYRPGT